MDYQTALHRHLLTLPDYERAQQGSSPRRETDLGRMRELLSRLGDPHLKTPAIHVAGTKGKGSTAAMIASVLAAAGHHTGLYTSPHLHTFPERIRVGLSPVSQEEFASLVERLWPVVEDMRSRGQEGRITTFEMLTAMAFQHFADIGADYQVLEVGLGGRLDATNTIQQPLACVITSLSLDHTAILGNTIQEIAREKAGIIKPGCVAVTAPQDEAAMESIAEACEEQGALLVDVYERYDWEFGEATLEGQSFVVSGPKGHLTAAPPADRRLWTPMLGAHQVENAVTAVATLDVLYERGVPVPDEALRDGIRLARWPGRLEVLQDNPLVLADGAHNVDSMARLRRAVQGYFAGRRPLMVLGISMDKDMTAMAEEVARFHPPLVVATRSRHPRAVPPETIAEHLRARDVPAAAVEGVAEAVELAISRAGENDLVLGTGSLFVVAEVIEVITGIEPELYPELPRSPRIKESP